ncbi:MAG TPA: hypothetical protein VFC29_18405 [Candidatus Limnocylindrales bacterium]|nr:hypothetical protein [Candidatus Limnocylindrales bacterium]
MERSVDTIRSYAVKQYVAVARRKGEKRVRIVAGDVHRALKLKNRVPNVCNALTSRIFLEQNHLAIEDVSGPPSGMGTRMIYTYRLLDEKESRAEATETLSFERLRGLLKESLQSLGGGEAFLRAERHRFYGHRPPEER